jgi:hypothetical protein
MRPGDTIPTIKTVGQTNELQYNNATNTAFGAPPVLVLRIGDFYNTKIIPTSLGLTYEDLDINPEGIGIQPMIANVTLGFNFIGGSGLKESVDKLQNALTFNYYANTEMYDDRADATDLSYKIVDKAFLNAIGAQPPAATVNQTQDNNPQTNESTIGDILSTSGTTGTTSYQKYMNNLVAQTQTYFQNYVNKSKECVKQYNNAMLQNLTCDRNYTKGTFLVDTTPGKEVYLIGKPNNVQQVVNNVFTDYVVNIESTDPNTQDLFINFMSSNKGFSPKVIRQLTMNLKNFVTNKTSTYQNAVTQLSQELVNQQQTFIQYLTRANVMPLYKSGPTTGTDGFQEKNGNVVIYDISGTTDVYNKTEAPDTFDEIQKDIRKIGRNISEYYGLLITGTTFDYNSVQYKGIGLYGDTVEQTTYEKYIKRVVFVPFTEGDFGQTVKNSFGNPTGDGTPKNYAFRRMYMILSPEILDDKRYQTFKDAMINNIINNKDILGSGSQDVAAQFDSYWIGTAKPQFAKENAVTTAFLDNLEKGKLKNFINYTPFPTKKRVFTFEKSTTPTASQTEVITGLGRVLANSDKQTWNNQDKPSAYVSKLKLN